MIKLVNEAPGRKATVNGLLGFAMQRANEQLASMQAAQRAEHEAWAKSLAEDKDFGGAKFAPTQNEVKRVLAQFGSPALEKVLNETGLGNHPELFRFFARVAGVTKEARPGPTAGAKPANGAMSQEDLAKRFFSGSTAQG